jgi:phosphopantothenate-cysteine ligase/phosphopantothenoylcysteine decarboxylase/phosphopantothenate--cysteine ligase
MHVVVTAGNTHVLVDRVRCITNIFTGRTGTRLALEAHRRGHSVTLLTSHPEVVVELADQPPTSGPGFRVRRFRSFDDLHELMEDLLSPPAGLNVDAVLHCAAVSDYQVTGAFALDPVTGERQALSEGKIKSGYPELWLKLVPTIKLVDQIRKPWGFQGILVKFKLEVGLSERELLRVAESARLQSQADLVCANTIEGMAEWAILGAGEHYEKIERHELAPRLLSTVERLAAKRCSGVSEP